MVKFRSNEELKDLLKKVKKMKEYAEMVEDCLKESMEDEDYGFRGGSGSYRKDWEEDEMPMHGSRYDYRRGGMRG